MLATDDNLKESTMEDLIQKYQPACVEFLRTLIQTHSVNGVDDEAALAAKIQEQAIALDLSSRLIEAEVGRPNVYVGAEDQFSNHDSMLFVAHGDTVPAGDTSKWTQEPFGAEIVNGKMFGRGALDCKGGIATSLFALKILEELGAGDKAKLLVGADEESGADSKIGIRHVLDKGLAARGAVYTYGGNVTNALTIGHRGVLRLWITAHGEATHSGSRDWQDGTKGASAIMALMQLLVRIEEYHQSIATKEHPLFPGYRCVITPTLLEGGSGESLVPDVAKVLLDIRTLPDQNNQQIVTDIQALLDECKTDKVSYELTIKNDVPARLSNYNDPFVRSAADMLREVYGRTHVSFKGSGPANEAHMLIDGGIPTVVGFGPTGEGFHSRDEYADVASVEQSLRALVTLALSE